MAYTQNTRLELQHVDRLYTVYREGEKKKK